MTLGRPSHDTTCCCDLGVGLFLLGNHVSGHEIRDRDPAPLHYAGTQVHHGGSDHVRSGMDTPQTPDHLVAVEGYGHYRNPYALGWDRRSGLVGTGSSLQYCGDSCGYCPVVAIILGWLLAGERLNSGESCRDGCHSAWRVNDRKRYSETGHQIILRPFERST